MPTDEDQKKIRAEIQKNQLYAILLGVSDEEILRINSPNPSPEIKAKREKVRDFFEKHPPLSEPKIVGYLIQRARNPHATIQKRDSCDVCGEPYEGAHPICGDCGHIIQGYL